MIDGNNVRDVLAFAENISKKEEKEALVSLVIGRWAEFDPQSAVASTQQMPAGPAHDKTILAVMSNLSEKDPQTALSILQSLPVEKTQQHFYWPIFSRWSASDPLAAAERAEQTADSRGSRDRIAGNRIDLRQTGSRCGAGVGEQFAR